MSCVPLAVLRGKLKAIQDGVRRFTPSSSLSAGRWLLLTKLVDDLHQLSMSDEGAGLPENLTGYHHPAGSGGGRAASASRRLHSGVAPGARR